MNDAITNGTRQMIDDELRVYHDGYWIKVYAPPEDTLSAKKRLIEALTRRLFNHVEYGLNVPGSRLAEARASYDNERDPQRRRIKGAMLAGALFNRATDIFTKLVELQTLGVEIASDNQLMRECGRCLQEALSLGKLVLHRSGEEGIDELWGEPFKAFTMPIDEFYESRYIKIAMTMRDIDRIADKMANVLARPKFFGAPLRTALQVYTKAAKTKCETLRTDKVIFDIWTDFVSASENVLNCPPSDDSQKTHDDDRTMIESSNLLREGVELMGNITRARVPMPKTTKAYLAACDAFASAVDIQTENWQGKTLTSN